MKFITVVNFISFSLILSFFITSIFYTFGVLNTYLIKYDITYKNLYSTTENHIGLSKINIDKKDYFYNFDGRKINNTEKSSGNFVKLKITKCIYKSNFNFILGMYDKDRNCNKDIEEEIILPKNAKWIKND